MVKSLFLCVALLVSGCLSAPHIRRLAESPVTTAASASTCSRIGSTCLDSNTFSLCNAAEGSPVVMTCPAGTQCLCEFTTAAPCALPEQASFLCETESTPATPSETPAPTPEPEPTVQASTPSVSVSLDLTSYIATALGIASQAQALGSTPDLTTIKDQALTIAGQLEAALFSQLSGEQATPAPTPAPSETPAPTPAPSETPEPTPAPSETPEPTPSATPAATAAPASINIDTSVLVAQTDAALAQANDLLNSLQNTSVSAEVDAAAAAAAAGASQFSSIEDAVNQGREQVQNLIPSELTDAVSANSDQLVAAAQPAINDAVASVQGLTANVNATETLQTVLTGVLQAVQSGQITAETAQQTIVDTLSQYQDQIPAVAGSLQAAAQQLIVASLAPAIVDSLQAQLPQLQELAISQLESVQDTASAAAAPFIDQAQTIIGQLNLNLTDISASVDQQAVRDQLAILIANVNDTETRAALEQALAQAQASLVDPATTAQDLANQLNQLVSDVQSNLAIDDSLKDQILGVVQSNVNAQATSSTGDVLGQIQAQINANSNNGQVQSTTATIQSTIQSSAP
eukprot:GILJ01013430.1.p1 GENE.GILJ01013430.1~~GILJ01013430.1.p1  ORF type:complete len:575 (+),score=122.93 GILJ01013430.1:226-1950(+)